MWSSIEWRNSLEIYDCITKWRSTYDVYGVGSNNLSTKHLKEDPNLVKVMYVISLHKEFMLTVCLVCLQKCFKTFLCWKPSGILRKASCKLINYKHWLIKCASDFPNFWGSTSNIITTWQYVSFFVWETFFSTWTSMLKILVIIIIS